LANLPEGFRHSSKHIVTTWEGHDEVCAQVGFVASFGMTGSSGP
jgi:hypothetical protein